MLGLAVPFLVFIGAIWQAVFKFYIEIFKILFGELSSMSGEITGDITIKIRRYNS